MRRVKINTDIERKILIGIIVSTSFCGNVYKIYRPDYFKMESSKVVAKWTFDYFRKHKQAPGKHIQDIFNVEKKRIEEEDEVEVIEVFLKRLSDEYEEQESFNREYILGQAKEYFRKRHLEKLFTDGKNYMEAGMIDQAEGVLLDHKVVSKETSGRFNPLDESEIDSWDPENVENRVFRFHGALGDMIGWMERGWLVSFTAPEKRGKTWWLFENFIRAMSARLKTVIFSLEMNKYATQSRFYRRITAMPTEEMEFIKYPVFDCYGNQYGSCGKKQRRNKEILYEKGDEKREYDPEMEYEPCTYCRKKGPDYRTAYWFSSVVPKGMISKKAIKQKAKDIVGMYGDNVRVVPFPAYSANSDDIRAELDDLEYSEDFIADVVIIDYIDILAPEKGKFVGRDLIDAVWKNFKNIAGTRNCLVITADQSNKQTYERDIGLGDTSEDKRKNAHVDIKIAINQNEDEEEDGVMRLSVIANRHKRYSARQQVMVLQQLDLAQPLLDSEWIVRKKK